jgi:hypothetical protein
MATAWLLTAPIHAADLIDRVLAVVSGSIITLSDARAAIEFGLVETGRAPDPVAVATAWLVDRQLALDEVNRSDSGEVDAAHVEARLSQIEQRFTDRSTFAASLARCGLDRLGARAFIHDTLRVERYLSRRFEAILPGTEEELRAHYAGQPGRFTRDGRPLTFDQARELVQVSLQTERRKQAIDAWLSRLRRRTDVTELYAPAR